MMEAVSSSKMSVNTCQTAQCNIPEDSPLLLIAMTISNLDNIASVL
jgi:hypothetical protein